ncbi:hypothetical protein BDBG_01217 [Blastomyces gilchristii SLH14081]|uniref:Uncharacterized protein n=1 Tax=Blastomyces gilchristii (strain SLH14081) TaxID=559298 RepID=A0A179UCE5_BLAGS|nr:uncharacterized protein BDBG_01217 [Blastomyces gilchristii SLH14081]OAT04711.1 hypothetical protein BDBG_01217 [Blastomyces gilchristii SLH14081]
MHGTTENFLFQSNAFSRSMLAALTKTQKEITKTKRNILAYLFKPQSHCAYPTSIALPKRPWRYGSYPLTAWAFQLAWGKLYNFCAISWTYHSSIYFGARFFHLRCRSALYSDLSMRNYAEPVWESCHEWRFSFRMSEWFPIWFLATQSMSPMISRSIDLPMILSFVLFARPPLQATICRYSSHRNSLRVSARLLNTHKIDRLMRNEQKAIAQRDPFVYSVRLRLYNDSVTDTRNPRVLKNIPCCHARNGLIKVDPLSATIHFHVKGTFLAKWISSRTLGSCEGVARSVRFASSMYVLYLVHRPPLWMMANQGLVPQIRHDAPGIPQEAKSERFQNRSKFAAPWQQDSNTANTC